MSHSFPEPSKSRDIPPLFLFVPAGILLNLGGVFLNETFSLPLFLDSTGTILAAVVLGPWLGAAVGFFSNLVIGLAITPIAIPFGIVNAAIGLIAGAMARRWGFRDLRVPGALVLALAALCPVLATPIAVYLFGGVTGGALDRYWAVLVQSGHQVFSSAFLVRLPATFADKLIGVAFAWVFVRCLPPRWRGLAEPPPRTAGSDSGPNSEPNSGPDSEPDSAP